MVLRWSCRKGIREISILKTENDFRRMIRRRVSSVVELALVCKSEGLQFDSGPGFILGVMDYDEACFMHLTPGMVQNFPKAALIIL